MSSSQLTNSMIFQRGGEKPPTSNISLTSPLVIGYSSLLKMAIEIVDFPINSMVILLTKKSTGTTIIDDWYYMVL